MSMSTPSTCSVLVLCSALAWRVRHAVLYSGKLPVWCGGACCRPSACHWAIFAVTFVLDGTGRTPCMKPHTRRIDHRARRLCEGMTQLETHVRTHARQRTWTGCGACELPRFGPQGPPCTSSRHQNHRELVVHRPRQNRPLCSF